MQFIIRARSEGDESVRDVLRGDVSHDDLSRELDHLAHQATAADEQSLADAASRLGETLSIEVTEGW